MSTRVPYISFNLKFDSAALCLDFDRFAEIVANSTGNVKPKSENFAYMREIFYSLYGIFAPAAY